MKIEKIRYQIEKSITDFANIVNNANSYTDLCKYYDLPNNGKQHKYLRGIIESNNLPIAHWNNHLKQIKYPYIEKDCPICKNKFTTQAGHPRETITCSCKCSNIYFSDKRHTDESKKKRSESIKKYFLSVGKVPIEKIKCIFCGNEKLPTHKNQRFCSNKCARKSIGSDPVYREKLRQIQLKCIAEGRHKGWNRHTIGQTPSYAEKFFMKVLGDYNISYEYDKKVGHYFVDFILDNQKFALEIDGRQHREKRLKFRDDKKDRFLTENGWKVYRIEWNSINNESGKKMMKEKISKFLEIYRMAL